MAIKAWDFLGVQYREDTTPNYWECGVYVPEIISGAGPIYVGRITRERQGNKWLYCCHTHQGRYPAYSRKSALRIAQDFAIRHPSFSQH